MRSWSHLLPAAGMAVSAEKASVMRRNLSCVQCSYRVGIYRHPHFFASSLAAKSATFTSTESSSFLLLCVCVFVCVCCRASCLAGGETASKVEGRELSSRGRFLKLDERKQTDSADVACRGGSQAGLCLVCGRRALARAPLCSVDRAAWPWDMEPESDSFRS